MRKVLVIGAGPAGMMAAGAAAECGAQVILCEKNDRVGKKLRITGKGRCNLTNCCDSEEFIRHLTSNARFMYSAIHHFSCYDTIDFFENLGLSTKVERGNRVFPASDRASDVVETLRRYILSAGVQLQNTVVKALLIENGSVKGVRTADFDIEADCVIVACGGLSYPLTGSTGDGYSFAKAAGHTITPILPSLVPLTSDDPVCQALQGLALKNVRITVTDNYSDKEIYSDFGEMLFTHFGVSGPVILSASAHMREMSVDRYTLSIDLKPALDEQTLDKRVLRDLTKFSNKDICNSLFELLPKSLVPVILFRAQIGEHTKCNVITAEQRKRLLTSLKHFELLIRGFRPIDEAIVTAGGVDVKEIDPRTMQSKLVKGLYFAGEVLDLDAYTGGFNLQIAYSTGRLAGESASKADSAGKGLDPFAH